MDWHRLRLLQEKTKIVLVIFVCNAQCPFMNMICSMIQSSIIEHPNKRTVAEMRQNESPHQPLEFRLIVMQFRSCRMLCIQVVFGPPLGLFTLLKYSLLKDFSCWCFGMERIANYCRSELVQFSEPCIAFLKNLRKHQNNCKRSWI